MTFDELGIPFPLFEAPAKAASNYAGQATCRLCGNRDQHCFDLGIGDAVILTCPACGVENGLDADDRADSSCRSCGSAIPFPAALQKCKQLCVCHACLRAGKAAMTKDTELGMVSWEQAFAGVTHGVPGLKSSDFELVLVDPEEDWYGARVPAEHLFELLRTPGILSWQDACWLFCCKRPMTYLGGWSDVLASRHQPEDPRDFFDRLAPEGVEKDEVWEAIDSNRACLYVYHCKSCGRFRSTWDSD